MLASFISVWPLYLEAALNGLTHDTITTRNRTSGKRLN